MNDNRQRNLKALNSDRVKKINKVIGKFNQHVTRLYESMADEDRRQILFNCDKLIEMAFGEKEKLRE